MSANRPLVSIIIDNYNYARFLPDAMVSALSQTYPSTEVIVVDDGSTDDSRSVIASYGARVVAVFQDNAGQAAALNAGFARSRGDVVVFLDADDTLGRDIIAQVVRAFASDPRPALVQYRLAVVGADGSPTVDFRPPMHVAMPTGDLREDLASLDNHTGWSPTSGAAYSAAVLRRVLPIPERTFRLCADEYLTRAAALCGPVRSLDVVGGTYRLHAANNYATSRTNAANLQATIRRALESHEHLRTLADRLGVRDFPTRATDMVNMTFLAYRTASMKLAPATHPIPGETLLEVAFNGAVAAWKRRDISAPIRALHVIWFAAMLFVPQRLAPRLARAFFYPETRGRINRLLAKWKPRRPRAGVSHLSAAPRHPPPYPQASRREDAADWTSPVFANQRP
ncbi:MAG TPA: glycosyltransferase family A protein [Chloroflexota bacterium]|nr:glycosyltransferase family A protein [Chloroflexota bacterium]